MDHFFWFGPDETEYTIEGFYQNQTKSKQFVFAKPVQERGVAASFIDDREMQKERLPNTSKSIGSIRIVFSLVDRWRKQPKHNSTCCPKQAVINAEAHIDCKGKELSVRPGDTIDDGTPTTERQAILSNDIVFEKRIIFNTFCGYRANKKTMRETNQIIFYQALPLSVLMQGDVRKQCIHMYLVQIPSQQMRAQLENNITEALHRNHAAGQSSSEGTTPAAVASVKADEWVRVLDLVRAISRDLSPAGSHLICTGKHHVDQDAIENYGEMVVQNTEATEEERAVDVVHKEKCLASYFTSSPHTYDIRDYKDEEGGIRFEVRLPVVNVAGDSDDDDNNDDNDDDDNNL
mmetsp:Transcript_16470/g.47300  ORF Transcript_16470/g.47300 Transcript_16470/m.47300 type:complete len:347 (-) Transcript_16470:386-1426(-)